MTHMGIEHRLPPFAALRAFEAAARLGSFKLAARELNRTPSAISHQIRSLEKFLGSELFQRSRNAVRVVPTATGKVYHAEICDILETLSRATGNASAPAADTTLRIGATPAFMSRWLMPRISDFSHRHPGFRLELRQIDQPLRFPDDGIDILVQYGSEPSAGVRVEPLLATHRFPVCDRRFLARHPELKTVEDLKALPLFLDEHGDGWAEWFAVAGSPLAGKPTGQVLPHCELTLRAAKESQGVTLAYAALIEKELEDGELVRLFEAETSMSVIYSISYREAHSNRPAVSTVRNWIFRQVPKAYRA